MRPVVRRSQPILESINSIVFHTNQVRVSKGHITFSISNSLQPADRAPVKKGVSHLAIVVFVDADLLDGPRTDPWLARGKMHAQRSVAAYSPVRPERLEAVTMACKLQTCERG